MIDSRQSSDNNNTAGSKTVDSALPLNTDPDDQVKKTHGYFIPAVITIVFGVVVISTFNGKALNSQVTGSALHDQAVALTSNTVDRSIAKMDTSSESEASTEPPAITEATDDHRQAREVTTTVTEITLADSTPVTAAPSSSATSAEPGLSAEISKLGKQKQPMQYNDRQNRMAYPVPPPMAYGLPEHFQTDYNPIWEQRRNAYEAMLRARHEHLMRMYEYRAAELGRNEQDNRYKRMQQLKSQNLNRRDELMHKMAPQETHAKNHPI